MHYVPSMPRQTQKRARFAWQQAPQQQELSPVKSASALPIFAAFASLLIAGCATKPKPEDNSVALVPVNAFAKAWTLPLNLHERRDSIRSLHLRDDTLFAYSERNRVTAMSAADGRPLYALDITPDGVPIKPSSSVTMREYFVAMPSKKSSASGKPLTTMTSAGVPCAAALSAAPAAM